MTATVVRSRIFRDTYRDSVELMRVTAEVERLPGIRRAALLVATPAKGQRGTIAEQFENSRTTARQIGALVPAGGGSSVASYFPELHTAALAMVKARRDLRLGVRLAPPPRGDEPGALTHRLRRYVVERRQFVGCERSTRFIAASFSAPCASAAPIDGNPSRDSSIVSPA
jgi:hypothetical protein